MKMFRCGEGIRFQADVPLMLGHGTGERLHENYKIRCTTTRRKKALQSMAYPQPKQASTGLQRHPLLNTVLQNTKNEDTLAKA